MLRKILYGIGGMIAFLVIISFFTPESELKNATPNTPESVIVHDEILSEEIEISSEVVPDIQVQEKQNVSSENKPQPKTEQSHMYYSVTSVVDGDTIKINKNGTIETLRLIGMDTPETVDPRKPVQCFGKEASNKAKELLSGKKIRIESDATQDTRDKYGRLLVYVHREDGLFFNKYMIEQGYAHEYTYQTKYKYQTEFKNAQQTAKNNNRGLWSSNTCNGNTTSEPKEVSKSTVSTPSNTSTTSEKFYTSSHYSAKLWYPASCEGWKKLSPQYLESYTTLEALLAKYPNKTKSDQCN